MQVSVLSGDYFAQQRADAIARNAAFEAKQPASGRNKGHVDGSLRHHANILVPADAEHPVTPHSGANRVEVHGRKHFSNNDHDEAFTDAADPLAQPEAPASTHFEPAARDRDPAWEAMRSQGTQHKLK